ncbi:MAG: dTDP-4-dehydrorhamnose reductase [Pirellulales bacterium]|nr:dTDP-4-dehydrorhamnose reductase [Pirellulales bacterium]
MSLHPILITGSKGLLGSELCRQLGQDAVGIDLPEFDITDRGMVARRIEGLRPRAVINTAAYTAVDRAEDEPNVCWAVNVAGVANLLDACCAVDAKFVQISTDYVFGGARLDERRPFCETDVPLALGVYAESKLEAERLVEDAAGEHLIVRTSGLYGPAAEHSAGNFVDTMLRLADAGSSIRVVDDQWTVPSYVPHVARAIAFLVNESHCGTFHVVNFGQTTWYGFAREIFELLGREVDLTAVSTADYPTRAWRPAYSVLDGGKYDSLPGRPAMATWQDALSTHLK